MKNAGKIKITADDFLWLDKGDVFECEEYEVGDELQESGIIVESEGQHYQIHTNHGNVDVEYSDIEFIE